jgi:nicotinate phosphoribosyltransferase
VDGVRAAIEVIRELDLHDNVGVRLDSGDLIAQAWATRQLLDDAGLHQVRIYVSGGLDEHDLQRFAASRAPIDAAGIGTQMGVSGDAPSLDSAYKLVVYDGRPVLKLSAGKMTMPGAKQVYRGALKVDEDVVAVREEPAPPGREPLLVPVMTHGRQLDAPTTVAAARNRFERDLEALPPAALDLQATRPPTARFSPRLRALADELTNRIHSATVPATFNR